MILSTKDIGTQRAEMSEEAEIRWKPEVLESIRRSHKKLMSKALKIADSFDATEEKSKELFRILEGVEALVLKALDGALYHLFRKEAFFINSLLQTFQ